MENGRCWEDHLHGAEGLSTTWSGGSARWGGKGLRMEDLSSLDFVLQKTRMQRRIHFQEEQSCTLREVPSLATGPLYGSAAERKAFISHIFGDRQATLLNSHSLLLRAGVRDE